MSVDPREPLDAIILPDAVEGPRPARRRNLLVVGVLGILLLAIVAVVGLAVFLGFSRDRQALAWRSDAQRRAALVSAFDGRRRDIRDVDLPEILRLLDEAASTSRLANAEGFRRLIDVDRFVQRIAGYPGQILLNPLDRSILKYQLRQDFDGVGDVDRFELMHLERPQPDHAIAYVYAFGDGIRGDPFRFLLHRGPDGWRIQDWERVESGWTQAEHYARAYIVGEHPHLDGYSDVWDRLEGVDTLIEAGEIEEASKRMPGIAAIRVPPTLSPMTQWRIALAYSQLGEWDMCLTICRSVDPSAAMPGIFSLEASCLNALGRYEETILATQAYEGSAGFQVDVLELKADALSALGRDEEAIDCRRRLAEFQPDELDLLSSYAEALPRERQAEVVEILRRAADPVASSVGLADRWFYRDKENLLNILRDFVHQQAPGSVHAFVLDGRTYEYLGYYDRAAASYRAAAERDPDSPEAESYWGSFLEAMVQEGKVVEGYRAAPDKRLALLQLAEGVEDGDGLISIDQLEPLLDAHREHFPEDPWLHYFDGTLADLRGDLPTAEREFSLAAASADEDNEIYYAPYMHRDILLRQGKVLEAYRAYPEDPDVFAELARHCHSEQDVAGLAALVEEHRKPCPDDPWIVYYEAVMKRLSNQPEAALSILETIEADFDTALVNSVDSLRLQLHVALGRWEEAYASSETPEETFDDLARELRSRRDWPALDQLCQQHRSVYPDDPAWLVSSVEVARRLHDHERIAQLLTPFPGELLDASYEEETLREQLVGSLLHLSRVDEALRRARQFAETDQDYLPWMIALDHTKSWEELGSLLDDSAAAEQFRDQFRWGDTDRFRNLRWAPEATSLRKRFLLPLPGGTFGGRVVLLLNKPPNLDRDRLLQSAGTGAPFEIRPLPVTGDNTAVAFEVRSPPGRMVVAAGSGTYCDESAARQLSKRHDDLAMILQEHDGWIEVQGVEASDPDDALALEQQVRRLAANLANDDVLAVHTWGADFGSPRLVAATQDILDALRRDGPLQPLFDDAAEIYLGRQQDALGPDSVLTDSERRRAFRSIAESLDGEGSPGYRIGVDLRLGAATERLWLQVIAAEHEGYGHYKWTAELLGDSRLWPGLKAGEQVAIDSDEIREWKAE